MTTINKDIKPSELLRLITTNGSSGWLCLRIKHYERYPCNVDAATINLILKRIQTYLDHAKRIDDTNMDLTYPTYIHRMTNAPYHNKEEERPFLEFLRNKLAIFLAEEFEAKGL